MIEPRHRRIALVALAAVGLMIAFGGRALAQDEAPEDQVASFTIGRDVVVSAGRTVDGDVLVMMGNLLVEEGAIVEGGVSVVAGDADIAGEVRGDVWATGDLVLRPSAVVDGNAAALGEIDVDSAALVTGDVLVPRGPSLAAPGAPRAADEASISAWQGALLALVTLALAGLFAALVAAVAPSAVQRVSDAIAYGPFRLFLLGMLASLLLPLLLAALVVVFPLIPVVIVAWILVMAIGGVGLAHRVGGQVAPGAGSSARAAVGAAILTVPLALALAAVPVMSALGIDGGAMVGTLACLMGIVSLISFLAAGGGLVTLLGMRPWPAQPPEEHPEPVPLPGLDGMPSAATESEVNLARAAAWSAALTSDLEATPLEEGALVEPVAGAAAIAAAYPVEDEGTAGQVEAETVADAVEAAEPADALVEPGEVPGEPTEVPEEPAEVPEERGEVPDETTEAPGEATAMPVEGPREAPAASAAADVREVPGVGPIHAHLLRMGGVRTVGDMAAATPSEVLVLIEAPGLQTPSAEAVAEWIASARAMAGR